MATKRCLFGVIAGCLFGVLAILVWVRYGSYNLEPQCPKNSWPCGYNQTQCQIFNCTEVQCFDPSTCRDLESPSPMDHDVILVLAIVLTTVSLSILVVTLHHHFGSSSHSPISWSVTSDSDPEEI